MNRRITLTLAAAIGSTLAFPLAASADQAILVRDATFEIDPGDVVEYTDVLVINPVGIPTVVFDGSTGFVANETVVATIDLSTQAIDGLGTVELVSSPTISGTTPAGWPTGAPQEFPLLPAIELRYTAPSAAELGCDDHPGERFTTHLGVSGTLVGSAGTMASFSADDFPGVVSFVITCPASAPSSDAPTAPTVTPPTTNTLPVPDGAGSRADWAGSPLLLAVAAAGGALVVLTRRSRTDRYRR